MNSPKRISIPKKSALNPMAIRALLSYIEDRIVEILSLPNMKAWKETSLYVSLNIGVMKKVAKASRHELKENFEYLLKTANGVMEPLDIINLSKNPLIDKDYDDLVDITVDTTRFQKFAHDAIAREYVGDPPRMIEKNSSGEFTYNGVRIAKLNIGTNPYLFLEALWSYGGQGETVPYKKIDRHFVDNGRAVITDHSIMKNRIFNARDQLLQRARVHDTKFKDLRYNRKALINNKRGKGFILYNLPVL